MTHLSFYFQAFFGAPSKHEGSSRDGGLANLPPLKFGILISPATAQKKKKKNTVFANKQKCFSATIEKLVAC